MEQEDPSLSSQPFDERDLLLVEMFDLLLVAHPTDEATVRLNRERRLVLRTAFQKLLYPLVENDIRQMLLHLAREEVAERARQSLRRLLLTGPLHIDPDK